MGFIPTEFTVSTISVAHVEHRVRSGQRRRLPGERSARLDFGCADHYVQVRGRAASLRRTRETRRGVEVALRRLPRA